MNTKLGNHIAEQPTSMFHFGGFRRSEFDKRGRLNLRARSMATFSPTNFGNQALKGSASKTLPPSSSDMVTTLTNRFLNSWGMFFPISSLELLRSKSWRAPANSVTESSDSSYTLATEVTNGVSPTRENSAYRKVGESFHAKRVWKASVDECMFCLAVKQLGPREAMWLAAKFHWKCQRPLQALNAMLNGHGRSYTKQSAKTGQLSGESASSRKRSSGA